MMTEICKRFRSKFVCSLIFIVVGIFLFAHYTQWTSLFHKTSSSDILEFRNYSKQMMHLVVTSCGNTKEQTLVMIKSVTLLTRTPFHVHIFASDDQMEPLTEELDSWPNILREQMHYSIYSIRFPNVSSEKEWKALFRPCATQRMFIPDVLWYLDAVLYVDSDVVFLRPLDDIWRIFEEFNDTQIAALAPESETPDGNWYLIHPNTPCVPPYGINSGVFLMNVTRMRQTEWLRNITNIYKIHKEVILLGDQDLANIYFYLYPERLYQLTCEWNYRTDHCEYSSNCRSAEFHGVGLIHGNRGVFSNEGHPIFKRIYQAFRDFKLGEDSEAHFYKRMLDVLLKGSEESCSKVEKILFRYLYMSLSQLKHIESSVSISAN